MRLGNYFHLFIGHRSSTKEHFWWAHSHTCWVHQWSTKSTNEEHIQIKKTTFRMSIQITRIAPNMFTAVHMHHNKKWQIKWSRRLPILESVFRVNILSDDYSVHHCFRHNRWTLHSILSKLKAFLSASGRSRVSSSSTVKFSPAQDVNEVRLLNVKCLLYFLPYCML